jgi:putative heme-binding domain-containing protein
MEMAMRLGLLNLLVFLVFSSVASADEPSWIWKQSPAKTERVNFKKTFDLKRVPETAPLLASCDNGYSLTINGNKILSGSDWKVAQKNPNVSKYLNVGENTILVEATNEGEIAGFVLSLKLGKIRIVSDTTWQAQSPKGEWHQAAAVAKYGQGPWGKVFGNAQGAGQKAQKPIPTTLAVTTLPGFKAEKIYDVDKGTQGSWVGMTVDHKGRLITTDQYGGIYRVTLTPDVSVEKLDVTVAGGHGVLYAFNSLYVMVNENVGKKGNQGLHRLTDTNGDDQYDKEEFIVPYKAGGEHGTHSAVLSPDKKSIYLVSGNNSDMPESATRYRMAKAWQEDHLLPRMADGRGHNRGRLAPGGFIMKVSPDGKTQEVICHGFRNEFDAAFNIDGELFAFDADMEYDIGAPWFRPTRVNHAVSGVDWGWRNGSGKWPPYYTDTLPATIDIGPGSPTGVSNGLGAKFPAKYQKAIYINDWTYGTMYAVHLEQDGASYKATSEQFVFGKPLPLTDVMIHPDGNMYFMVGGRRTTSALYRLSYVGDASTTQAKAGPINPLLKLRRELETLHEHGVGEEAVAKALPYIGHDDRFIRYAARVALEKQPAASWQKALSSARKPWAVIELAAALARVGAKEQQTAILTALNRLDGAALPTDQLLAAIRSYQLAMTRHGKPTDADAVAVIAALNPLYPHSDNMVNREMAQVLLYLEAPEAVTKTVRMVLSATDTLDKILSDEILARNDNYASATKRMEQFRPNVQQFALAFSLRSIATGWTEADRASYFSWFPRAKTWQGGNSYNAFIENSRKEALAHVSDPELKAKYDAMSNKAVAKARAVETPKGPGRVWTVDEAVKSVKDNLSGRDFASGENLFHATACAACHRFAGEGSGIGPDLTGAASRYTVADMLENIIAPSKVISDQYGSTHFTMKDGSSVIGRVGGEDDGVAHIMTNPFSPDSNVDVKLADVKTREPFAFSPMPTGLANALNADELSDLVAYIFSAGDPEHAYFAPPVYKAQLEGAESLFDGKTLDGWKGKENLWSVKDGVIQGTTHGNKIGGNTFLIWSGGEVEDFHLSYESRCVGNNSGVMYRSQVVDQAGYVMRGYQCDLHPKAPYTAMIYGEKERGIIITRGQTMTIDAAGKKTVVTSVEPETVDVAQWQTYEIICKDNHIVQKLNGEVAIDLVDDFKDRIRKGSIGLQLHAGAPMLVEFRNIQLKRL